MKTKLITHWLLLLGMAMLITGCSRGYVVGKHPISEFYDDPQMQELSAAAARGDVKTIDRLVSEGADVNRQGKEGMLPLLWAFGAHNEKGFLRLLERGADPNAVTELGGSVIKLAVTDKNPAFLKMALEHGGNPNWTNPRNGKPIIFEAVNAYYREPLKMLIAAGADLNAIDRSDSFLCAPLHVAATLNQYDIVYMLLQAGANYTLTDRDGDNPLLYSIENHQLDPNFKLYPWRAKVVEWLRERGVQVIPSENDGFTVRNITIRRYYSDPIMQALSAASARGDVETIDRLVSEGADVNLPGKDGVTPLLWAFRAFNHDGFLSLLNHGADPNGTTTLGGAVIKETVGYNDPFYLKEALAHGGNPNWVDPVLEQPLLRIAYAQNYLKRISWPVDMLIQAGADINAKGKHGDTLISSAISRGDYSFVYKLLELGADYSDLVNKDADRFFLKDSVLRTASDSERNQWRNKVIESLRERGVEVTPAN